LQPEYSPAYSALQATHGPISGTTLRPQLRREKAMDLAQNLPQQARLQTEARHHEMNGDWTQAIEAYSRCSDRTQTILTTV